MVKDHWLIVVYTIEGDVIKIMTVIDVSSINNFIGGHLEKGRWIEVK
jgi:hypothetical protein